MLFRVRFWFVLLALIAAGCQTSSPTGAPATPVNTLVATPLPTLQATMTTVWITATPLPPELATALATEEVGVSLQAVAPGGYPPPLTIALPSGWLLGDSTITITNFDGGINLIPFTTYTGPVTGGTGYIVVLWGYPRLAAIVPNADPRDLQFADGSRLLRLAVVESGCNVGIYNQRTFRVGLYPAIGTTFTAVDCPVLPDTRGWFATLAVGEPERELNFSFFAYTDPITAMDGSADDEMQAILDSVRFTISPDTLAPGNATATALAQTP